MCILFSHLSLVLMSRHSHLIRSLLKTFTFDTSGEKELVKQVSVVVTYEQFKDMFSRESLVVRRNWKFLNFTKDVLSCADHK